MYNILDLTDLFRYSDELDLDFNLNIMHEPARLAVQSVPPLARAVAAERLMKYHDEECRRLYRRPMIKSLADYLTGNDKPADMKVLGEFMLFTNDLDVTRGQDFRAVHAEFVELMAQDGFKWTSDTLHAKGDTRNRPARDRAYAWV